MAHNYIRRNFIDTSLAESGDENSRFNLDKG